MVPELSTFDAAIIMGTAVGILPRERFGNAYRLEL